MHYQEGCHGELQLQELVSDVRTIVRLQRWKRRATTTHTCSIQERVASALEEVERIPLTEIDSEKLNNLIARRNTYGDICQGFEAEQIKEFLAASANHVPTVLLMMQEKNSENGQIYMPPAFFDDACILHQTAAFKRRLSSGLWYA